MAELVVALTLAAVLAAMAVAALAGAERHLRRARASSTAKRVLREAQAVLATDLRAAASDSVRTRGDTAVDFVGLVGLSVACVASGTMVVLPPDASSAGPPYSSWRATPESGDVLVAFDSAAGGLWRAAVVDTASSRADGAGCTPASGLISAADAAARRPVMRLVLRSALDPAVAAPGSPVRVLRAGRYALTRGADGSWSLSYRRCADGICGVAQPVVGPLAGPSDSGLVFRRTPDVARLEVFLRTPPAAPGAPRDSVRLRVALRNRTAGSP